MTQSKYQVDKELRKAVQKESELRFRRLFESSQDGILILDADTGEIIDANPFLINLLGYSQEEIRGKQLWEIGLFDEIEKAKTTFKELEQKKYIRYDDLPLATKDGKTKAVEFVGNIYEVDQKHFIQCNIRDITERKKAHQEIASMAKLHAENPSPVLRLAHDGTLIYANEASQKILEEWNTKIGEPAPKFWRDVVTETLKKQDSSIVDLNYAGRSFSFFVAPVVDSNYVNLYARDETKRKEAEEALLDNEVRYHSLFMNMLEGLAYCRMIFVDGQPQDFIHLDINNAFESLTGLKNVAGRRISEVIPGILESDPLWIEALGRVSLSGKSEIFEIYIEALHNWYKMSVYCPQKEYFIAIFDVISERKQSMRALQASETKFRSYIEHAPLGVFVADQFGRYVEVNEAAAEMMGYTESELLQLSISDVLAPQSLETGLQLFMKVVDEGSASAEFLFSHKDGTQFWSTVLAVRLGSDRFMSFSQNINVHKQNVEKLKVLSSAVEQTADSVFITDHEGVIQYVNAAFERLTGYTKEDAIGKTQRVLKLNINDLKDHEQVWHTINAGKVFQGDVINRKKNGVIFYEKQTITPIMDESGRITHFVSTGKDITEQNQREREMNAIANVSSTLRAAETTDEMLNLLLEKTLEVMNIEQGAIWLYYPEENELRPVVRSGWDTEGDHIIPPEKPGHGINGRVFVENKPYVSKKLHEDENLPKTTRQFIPPDVGSLTVPICSGDEVIGTFNVNVNLPREIDLSEIRLISALSELAGNAIQRMSLFEKTQKDALRFAALHAIDMSINANDTLETILNFLLDKIVELLKVSACDILIFDSSTQTLEYAASKGYRTNTIEQLSLHLGEDAAGQVAFERRIIDFEDLITANLKFSKNKVFEVEGFKSYVGVPLISKGKLIGVLEILNRTIVTRDSDWMDFLQAIASLAAIAIDSANLFNGLQQSNIELLQAYDTTIEGWSRAMDLRDQETEGHTQRVAELAVRMAQEQGLGEEEIAQLRRGALLHDMGKLGVPDRILQKAGPLTEEEWGLMRNHPRYAFDLLSPIDFLEPALDIPYCHHEKWDGTGYPRGLEGEQIPIAARLFAIIDVWDALRSDRPYRKAWSEEKALEHIKSLSGTHFDPQIVNLFLEMIENNK